jgi:hypothetical protein
MQKNFMIKMRLLLKEEKKSTKLITVIKDHQNIIKIMMDFLEKIIKSTILVKIMHKNNF